jgi:hypothetical protein
MASLPDSGSPCINRCNSRQALEGIYKVQQVTRVESRILTDSILLVSITPNTRSQSTPTMSLVTALARIASRTRTLSTLRRLSPTTTPGTQPRARAPGVYNIVFPALHHRSFSHFIPARSGLKLPTPTNPHMREHPKGPTLFTQITRLPQSARYPLYAGFALVAAGETAFWGNLVYAKWFAKEEQRADAELLLERFREALKGYRARWMVNYGRYWGAALWGL